MANTPITPFRLDEETKSKLADIAMWRNETMTNIVVNAISAEYKKASEVVQITWYIDPDTDAYFGSDEVDHIDIDASMVKLEEMTTAKIKRQYPNAEIECEKQFNKEVEALNMFNFESTDAAEYIQSIIEQVWEAWDWLVEK